MKRVAFLLQDRCALMSTALALEPLRAANLFSGTEAFRVTLLSLHGPQAVASVGAHFNTMKCNKKTTL
ncbi:hypothetical protein N0B44_06000 [Roseibacterium beibuensis]|uniref:hypothetical protein n=1 Tax=[Roseibacterium] beibuensis TaxID=1193142 RepID=UPI00217D62EB|nr:hypothetical protein [Roseibacterium beibuensis]MCS6622460.1 hypothetical protein [Roseibacterium beibuensis]